MFCMALDLFMNESCVECVSMLRSREFLLSKYTLRRENEI